MTLSFSSAVSNQTPTFPFGFARHDQFGETFLTGDYAEAALSLTPWKKFTRDPIAALFSKSATAFLQRRQVELEGLTSLTNQGGAHLYYKMRPDIQPWGCTALLQGLTIRGGLFDVATFLHLIEKNEAFRTISMPVGKKTVYSSLAETAKALLGLSSLREPYMRKWYLSNDIGSDITFNPNTQMFEVDIYALGELFTASKRWADVAPHLERYLKMFEEQTVREISTRLQLESNLSLAFFKIDDLIGGIQGSLTNALGNLRFSGFDKYFGYYGYSGRRVVSGDDALSGVGVPNNLRRAGLRWVETGVLLEKGRTLPKIVIRFGYRNDSNVSIWRGTPKIVGGLPEIIWEVKFTQPFPAETFKKETEVVRAVFNEAVTHYPPIEPSVPGYSYSAAPQEPTPSSSEHLTFGSSEPAVDTSEAEATLAAAAEGKEIDTEVGADGITNGAQVLTGGKPVLK